MSNLLTNSRLRAYRECARKHHLMYDEGWRPARDSEALAVGSAVHVALAAWWSMPPDVQGLPAALAAVKNQLQDEYAEQSVRALVEGYDARWGRDRELYETLLVERIFEGPLVNPATGAPSRTWTTAGKVDAVVRRLSDGKVLLVEHKTTSDEIADPTALYWEKLAMDSQVSHYYLGAEQAGHAPEGCLYDVIHKPLLRPKFATPHDKRRYTKTGALHADQRDVDETPEQYGERVRQEVESAPARHYRRREVPRTEADLLDYLYEAWQYGKQIREAELAGRHPKNPEACHRYGTCPFWEHCAHGLRLEDHPSRFVRLDDVHPELRAHKGGGGK